MMDHEHNEDIPKVPLVMMGGLALLALALASATSAGWLPGSQRSVKGRLTSNSISTRRAMTAPSHNSPIPQTSPIAPAHQIDAAEPAPCT